PGLQNDETAPVHLTAGEYLLRKERGEAPNLEEYLVRFPHLEPRLRRWHEVQQALQTNFVGELAWPETFEKRATTVPDGAAAVGDLARDSTQDSDSQVGTVLT